MRRIDYVILYARDLEASVAFYRDRLRLDHAFTRDGYAEFRLENLKLGILESARAKALTGGEPRGGGAEILFLVEDADLWASRLRDEGITPLSGPEDRPWGHRTVHVQDPDGHIVELAQEIPRNQEQRKSRDGGI